MLYAFEMCVCVCARLVCVLYISFIIYSSAGSAECLLHLFVYSIMYFAALYWAMRMCAWIIFGYVWVYYVISPVDIEREWLQINSKIANQLCPSLRIKITVSKLNTYIMRVFNSFFPFVFLSFSLCLAISVCVYVWHMDFLLCFAFELD